MEKDDTEHSTKTSKDKMSVAQCTLSQCDVPTLEMWYTVRNEKKCAVARVRCVYLCTLFAVHINDQIPLKPMLGHHIFVDPVQRNQFHFSGAV